MNQTPKLSLRLSCAAEMVRAGAVVSDVGTDHAYLPIYLCATGRAVRAVASDVNAGPIARAKENVAAWGLSDRIDTLLCDGLCAVEPYAPTDILILGMGGELIVRILSDAPFVRDGGRRLILQPMTHPEAVRAYLFENGYTIVDERLIKEEKIYQILCAEYTGKREDYTALEALVGKKNLQEPCEVTRELVSRWRAVFSERLRGKRSVGGETPDEERILAEIEEWEERNA